MGYYMRFIIVDDCELTLPMVAEALNRVSSSYELAVDSEATYPCADLLFEGDLYAEVEINAPGDGLFEEELDELKESVQDVDHGDKAKVLEVLHSAKATLAVRVLFGGRDAEDTMGKLDPLWEWLLANRQGLLQADGEGYYDSSGLILEVD